VYCRSCGKPVDESQKFCRSCGTRTGAGDVSSNCNSPAGTSTALGVQPAPAAPALGVVGFVLVIIGLFVPLLGLLGLVLSWTGLRRAKREGLPTGLSFAGTVIGSVATASGVVVLVVLLGVGGIVGHSHTVASNPQRQLFVGYWICHTTEMKLEISPSGSGDLLVTYRDANDIYSPWLSNKTFEPSGSLYIASVGVAAPTQYELEIVGSGLQLSIGGEPKGVFTHN
jgi:zinc-ribbon domain